MYDVNTSVTELKYGEYFIFDNQKYVATGKRDKNYYNILVFKENATHDQV